MSKPIASPEIPAAQRANRLWAWCLRSPMVSGVLVVIGIVVLFYAVENKLGERAWARCKQALAAQGALVDPAAQATTAIPDHLNVLKAPWMSEWFLSPTPNELVSQLGAASRKTGDSADLIEITVVSPTNQSTPTGSDLCLEYDPPLLALAGANGIETAAWNPPQVIPLIVMDSVPLSDAIKNLAVQDGRKYQLDSNIISSWGRAGFPEPCVNVRWENVTAFQALVVLLDNYNLVWIEDPTNHIGRISIKSEFSSIVQLTPAARAQVQKIVTQVSSLRGAEVHTLKASQGFVLYHQDNPSAGIPIHPARITVRSGNVPCVKEVEAFFPGPLPRFRAASGLRALPSGTNSFRVFADPPCLCSAEDYLARTDPGKPAFDLMREALKRPYARMNADYHRAVIAPPRNFVSVRTVSQALAQRAQAYLLLGQPEQALEEVTLLHALSAVVEADPLSLVAAMIETAITGMYVEVVHDGLRMGAWGEPQLIVLQRQLEKVHLGPLLVDGLSNERRAKCLIIETASASEFAEVFDPNRAQPGFWPKLKSPSFCVLTFGPRGWRYQSMVASATLLQSNIACFDLVSQTVRPDDIERANSALEAIRQHGSPRTSLAAIAMPNLTRAWQVVARNQSLVDQAFIACALERFRLAHGEYPHDLAALTPGFADRLPRGIIGEDQFHYRRSDAGSFRLYSDGWSGKDKSASDRVKGDWDWN